MNRHCYLVSAYLFVFLSFWSLETLKNTTTTVARPLDNWVSEETDTNFSNTAVISKNYISSNWSSLVNRNEHEFVIQIRLVPKESSIVLTLWNALFCQRIRFTSFKTKRWFKGRVSYYSNSDATFNFSQLIIELSGDVHPLPGPVSGQLHQIPVRITNRSKTTPQNHHVGVSSNNIYVMKSTNCKQQPQQSPLVMCVWNCQSIRNKTAVFHDYLCEKRIDLCALTETWLSADDVAVKSECLPSGYKIYDYPRKSRGGGGIALIAKEGMFVSLTKSDTMRSFEFAEFVVSTGSFKTRLVIIYRTPYSSTHPVTVSTFLEEFADFLETIVLSSEPLLIVGDMNIHVDVVDNDDAVKFLELLESMALTQHVRTPTHQCGHTLDLIITREVDNIVLNTPISDCFMSDHCTVLCKLTGNKPPLLSKEVRYRRINSIDIETLKEDI